MAVAVSASAVNAIVAIALVISAFAMFQPPRPSTMELAVNKEPAARQTLEAATPVTSRPAATAALPALLPANLPSEPRPVPVELRQDASLQSSRAIAPAVELSAVAPDSELPAIETVTPARLEEPDVIASRRLFDSGDVVGARRHLELLAGRGVPAAALTMGMTYDPHALKARGLTHFSPDSETALSWYRRAHMLAEAERKAHASKSGTPEGRGHDHAKSVYLPASARPAHGPSD